MEASRFGFGRDMAAAFKFDPTDADIVASYLLPRAVGLDEPHGHGRAVIDDDPMSLPPWDLMEKHNHGTSHQAFFFGPPRNGGPVKRVVPGKGGGTWQGQNGSVGTVTLFCDGDGDGARAGEVDISYRRYDLTYKRAGDKAPSGWVMSEYQITSPPLLSTVLTRIGLTVAAREQRKRQPADREPFAQHGPDKVLAVAAAAAAAAEHQRVSPPPVQSGPDAQADDGALYHGGTSVTGVGENGGHYTVPLLLNGQEYYKDKSRVKRKRRRYGA
ncbi:uncharacterized protein LOC119300301 [Triticum dicoccoides]|uniref:uncharacterized protein LOC119300301 n=1 Tax=Triticum dicoccoides TaxID=85692 RepID=UPI001890A993|nr:uncharacterized protein LOC119300301 [Triticum dicoccoides]